MFISLPWRALEVESPSREAIQVSELEGHEAQVMSAWVRGPGCELKALAFALLGVRLMLMYLVFRFFGTGLFILYHCMLEMCNLLEFYRSLQYGDCLHFSEETLALEFWIMLKLEDCGDLWSWTKYILHYELAMSLWEPRAEYCIWMWNSPQGQVFNTRFPSL